MRRIKLVSIALAACLVGPTALANDLQGAFIQGGVEYVNSTTEMTFPGWFNADPSESSTVGHVAAGYAKAFGRYTLALQGFVLLGDQDAGTEVRNYSATESGDTISMTLHDTWGISLEPGARIGESMLVYLKLGYTQTSGDWRFVRPAQQDAYSGHDRYSGYFYGAGLLKMFNDHFYGYAECRRADFGEQTVSISVTTDGEIQTFRDSFEPGSISGTIGVGYQF